MNTFTNQRVLFLLRHYVQFTLITSITVGLLVWVGWLLDINVLKRVAPGYTTMKPITALVFILAGIVLWCLHPAPQPKWKTRLGFLLAIIIIFIGGMVFLEYALKTNLSLDLWLFRNAVLQEGGLYPGRSSPATALCVLFVGISFLAVIARSFRFVNVLALTIFAIAFLAVVGYAFDVSQLYRFEPYGSMALHTALLLTILAMGILSLFPEQTVMGIFTTNLAGGILARRLIPAILFIPLVLGLLDLKGRRLGLYSAQFELALYSMLGIFLFAGFVFMTARSLNQADLHRTRALDSLREIEIKYQTIVEQTPAIVYVDEIGGNWRYISPQITTLLGYSPDEFLRDPKLWGSRIHPEDVEPTNASLTESKLTGKPFNSEFRFFTKSGNLVWLRDEAVVIQEQTSSKLLLQGIMFDITERKQAEEQIQYLAHLLENVNDAIIASDQNYILKAWNASAEKMYGWKAEEVIGKQGISVLQTQFPNASSDEMRRQIIEQGSYIGEATQRRKDGSKIHVEVATMVLHDRNGNLTGFVSVNRDITDRKLAEKNLRTVETRYRTLVEKLPIIVYVNPANDINTTSYVSPQVESLLGYTQVELLSNPKLWSTILHPEDYQRVLAEVEHVNQTGEPFDIEYRIIAKDGREIWVHDQATLLHDPTGQPLFWQGMMIDLTEQKQVEKEREAKLILEAKNMELDRFAYTVSHDLRSPLVTIKGFLDYLRRDINSGNLQRAAEDLQYAQSAVIKMDELLTGVLTLSRAGLTIKEPEEISFDELAHETIDLLKGTLDAGQAAVTIAPHLPVILGDRIRLRQVLQNLVENAIKYRSPQRSPHIEIGTRESQNAHAILFVRDNGMGIAPEYQEQIFGLFDKLNPQSEGSGVGLATVKRIIEVHGGQIWVESEPGIGSTFLFTLPTKPNLDSVI